MEETEDLESSLIKMQINFPKGKFFVQQIRCIIRSR